jgi:S1-C subfamily serine protease
MLRVSRIQGHDPFATDHGIYEGFIATPAAVNDGSSGLIPVSADADSAGRDPAVLADRQGLNRLKRATAALRIAPIRT